MFACDWVQSTQIGRKITLFFPYTQNVRDSYS